MTCKIRVVRHCVHFLHSRKNLEFRLAKFRGDISIWTFPMVFSHFRACCDLTVTEPFLRRPCCLRAMQALRRRWKSKRTKGSRREENRCTIVFLDEVTPLGPVLIATVVLQEGSEVVVAIAKCRKSVALVGAGIIFVTR